MNPLATAAAMGARPLGPHRSLLPAKLAALIPESQILTELHEVESEIDAMLHQKRMELFRVTEPRPMTQVAKTRVYLYTTQHAATALEPACWVFHIQGRLLDLDDNEISTLAGVPNFTALIRSLRIKFERVDGTPLDEAEFGGPTEVTWSFHRCAAAPTDALEIRRLGSPGGVRVQLELQLQRDGDDTGVSEELGAVLGSMFMSASEVLPAFWKYLETHKLIMPEKGGNVSFFKCDDKLRAVFDADTVPMTETKDRIQKHLSRPSELQLTLDLVEGPFSGPLCAAPKEAAVAAAAAAPDAPSRSPHNLNCYDLMLVLTATREYVTQMACESKAAAATAIDDRAYEQQSERAMLELLRSLDERRRRRAFFLGFAENPSLFITDMMEAHGLDLRQVPAPAGAPEGGAPAHVAMDRSSLFGTGQWVDEASMRLMFKELRMAPQQGDVMGGGQGGAADPGPAMMFTPGGAPNGAATPGPTPPTTGHGGPGA